MKKDLQQSRQGLQEIQRKLELEKKKREEASRREKNVLSRLDSVDRQIERLQRESGANRSDLTATRRRIKSLEELRREAEVDLRAERISMARRLKALHRTRAADPLLSMALGSQSPSASSRRTRFTFLLARSNQRLLERIEKRRAVLEGATVHLTKEQRRREKILGAIRRQTGRVERERVSRHRLLASIRSEKVVRDAAIQELDGAAKNLRGKVEELLQQALVVEDKARQERLAREQAEAKRVPSGTGSEERSDQKSVAARSAPPLVGGLGLRRGLAWPVKGMVFQPFGKVHSREFNATVESSGVQIRAAKGSPIRAVAPGRVRYADWFQGYGKLVILDHSKGYYSLYAQASDLYVSPGDSVSAGTVIGTVGDTGSLVGDSLYFEIRKDGLPQNPLFWLKPRT